MEHIKPTPEEIKEEERKWQEYLKTAEAALDDYIKNEIEVSILTGIARNKKKGEMVIPPEHFANSLKEFIEGMEEIIRKIDDGSLKASGSVTREVIQEFMNDAKNIHDATDENAIRALYEKYRSIRGLDKKNEKEK